MENDDEMAGFYKRKYIYFMNTYIKKNMMIIMYLR